MLLLRCCESFLLESLKVSDQKMWPLKLPPEASKSSNRSSESFRQKLGQYPEVAWKASSRSTKILYNLPTEARKASVSFQQDPSELPTEVHWAPNKSPVCFQQKPCGHPTEAQWASNRSPVSSQQKSRELSTEAQWVFNKNPVSF